MIVKGGKIVEATESELFAHYLKCGWDDVMSFIDYKDRCIKMGTKVVDDDDV